MRKFIRAELNALPASKVMKSKSMCIWKTDFCIRVTHYYYKGGVYLYIKRVQGEEGKMNQERKDERKKMTQVGFAINFFFFLFTQIERF